MKRKMIHNVYQYMAVFEPDEKEGGFTVTIPALPGCISEGNTFEEAFKNIREAAILYLEIMRDRKTYFPTESKNAVIAPIEVMV